MTRTRFFDYSFSDAGTQKCVTLIAGLLPLVGVYGYTVRPRGL